MIELIKVSDHFTNKLVEEAIKLASAKRFLEDKALTKYLAMLEVSPDVERLAAQIEFSSDKTSPDETAKLAIMYGGVIVNSAGREVAAWLPN